MIKLRTMFSGIYHHQDNSYRDDEFFIVVNRRGNLFVVEEHYPARETTKVVLELEALCDLLSNYTQWFIDKVPQVLETNELCFFSEHMWFKDDSKWGKDLILKTIGGN